MTLPPAGDVFALAAALVDVPSVSFSEGPITDLVEAELRIPRPGVRPGLTVHRIGDNLVARTDLGRARRILLAGHTDTVGAGGDARARIRGDVLWGLGATDMKGGLAVLVELARTVVAPAVDVTFVFYAREEVNSEHNGLLEVAAARPDLLEADVALLGEPTDGAVEAGCQGTMRLRLALAGRRAHTARAWMGRNAIHRLGGLLEAVDAYEPRRPVVGGCEYREGLQAVAVDGGVAGNVVPDEASVTLNYRFAPDRTPAEAEQHLRGLLAAWREDGDAVEVTDMAPPAEPGLDHPLMEALIRRSGAPVRAKLGWTDVAFFAARGVPASNFGPGDPRLAHTAEEHVHRRSVESVLAALKGLLERGA